MRVHPLLPSLIHQPQIHVVRRFCIHLVDQAIDLQRVPKRLLRLIEPSLFLHHQPKVVPKPCVGTPILYLTRQEKATFVEPRGLVATAQSVERSSKVAEGVQHNRRLAELFRDRERLPMQAHGLLHGSLRHCNRPKTIDRADQTTHIVQPLGHLARLAKRLLRAIDLSLAKPASTLVMEAIDSGR